jgi:hypothetical protein
VSTDAFRGVQRQWYQWTPVYFNSTSQISNSAYLWKDFKFNVDFLRTMSFVSGYKLKIPFTDNDFIIKLIKQGDTYYLNNLFVGTSSYILLDNMLLVRYIK